MYVCIAIRRKQCKKHKMCQRKAKINIYFVDITSNVVGF